MFNVLCQLKPLWRWMAIAVLGLWLSLSLHHFAPTVVVAQDAIPTLVQTGKQQYDSGQFAEAAQSLQTAARSLAAQGDQLRQAQALSWASLAYQKLGNWDAARTAIATSLSLLNSSTPLLQAQALNVQAHLYQGTGNIEAALQTWQQAEVLYAKVDDQPGVIGSQINQVRALQSLGFFRRAEKQLAQLEQAILQLPDSALKVAGLHTLGTVRQQAGNVQQAQQLLTTGLTTAKTLALMQDESKLLLSRGNTEWTLANQATDQGDSAQAKEHWQRAIADYQQAIALAPTPLLRVQARLNLLKLQAERQSPTLSKSFLTELFHDLDSLPPSRASVFASVNFAQTWMKLDDQNLLPAAKVAQLLATAIEQSNTLQDVRSRSFALGTLGALYEQTGQGVEAQTITRQALQLAQLISAPELTYQWQWQMGRLLRSSKQPAMIADAIAYYGAAVQTIHSLRSDLVALNPDVQFSFRESVEPVYRQFVDLLLQAENPSPENLMQARSAIEALQLAEIDNFFRDACARVAAVNIDDLDPTAAILYPILLRDRLELIVKLPNSPLQHYRVPVPETQIDQTVNQLRTLLRRRSSNIGRIKQTGQTLYDWLIRPWEANLPQSASPASIKTIVFILDGSLRNLPPSVLFDGRQYLVERYAIAVTPSLQLLDPKPLPRERINVLLAGATDAPSFERNGFSPIENVEIELKNIQGIVPHQTLKNQIFVRENLQQRIQTSLFNVVHVATHGQFSSNPEQTFILDWRDRIPVKEFDTLLRSGVQSNSTPIELLILSACETAAGDNRAALGLAGIAIRAGARSTLATLFQVNDASTAELMTRFYQQLQNPQLTKAEALRQAQLSFLQATHESPSSDLARPYFWAPFILVGNWL